MNFLKLQQRLTLLRTKLYTRLIRNSFGAMGKDCTVLWSMRSHHPEGIFIGDRVFIGNDAWIDTFPRYANQTFTPRLDIGSDTMIGHHGHIMVIGHMKIGRHVLIANGVYISDNLHGYEDVSRPVFDQPLVHRPVEIGDEAWIGENVCVLPGVKIGRHSVIGSNSVVTRDIPPYCVAVGAPAAVIRRFDGQEWNRVGKSDARVAVMRSIPAALNERVAYAHQAAAMERADAAAAG
ncbi:MAG: acyltransferase [Phycisphaerales bacterium]|nr:acyltransferase [Phycisphaerales bacterium]